MNNPIQTKPVPYCPNCGAQMRLRKPRDDQRWEPFWGCSTFPDCHGSRNILPDGRAEPDEPENQFHWEDKGF